jgi:hypothetical protein
MSIVEGIERAIFGEVTADDVTGWLDQQVYAKLSLHVQDVLFRSGRLAAVYGLQLSDASRIVAKVHRRANLAHLRAASTCQRVLANGGYPCPVPLSEPTEVDTRAVILETLLEAGERGDPRHETLRRAMARSLAQQITMLHAAPVTLADFRAPPAWTCYERGPWPPPHDPIFDFTKTPSGYEWLDLLADAAASRLLPRRRPDCIGHSDWVGQNLRFTEGEVSAAYDWDSLIGETEPVLVGIIAGSFTEGSTSGGSAPTPDEMVAFLSDYEVSQGRPFSNAEQATAAAAASWVLAYNARCGVSTEIWGHPTAEGSPLNRLAQYGKGYLHARW